MAESVWDRSARAIERNELDIWTALIQNLDTPGMHDILLKQLRHVDTLTLLRLISAHANLRAFLQKEPSFWSERLHKLETVIQGHGQKDPVDRSLSIKRNFHVETIETGFHRSQSSTTFYNFNTAAWNAFFVYERMDVTFLIAWSLWPHEWKDEETQTLIEAQDWYPEFVFPKDWTEEEKALMRNPRDYLGFYAQWWLQYKNQPMDEWQFVGISNWIDRGPKGLDALIQRKMTGLVAPKIDAFLRAIPSFVVRQSKNRKDFSIVPMRYGHESLVLRPMFLFGMYISTNAKNSRLFAFDGVTFKEQRKLGDFPVPDTGALFNHPKIYVPCFDLRLSSDFKISLFWGDRYCFRIRIISRKSMQNYPMNYTMKGHARSYDHVFEFESVYINTHFTKQGALSIDTRICDNCEQPFALATCGHGCNAVYYCNQACADAHYAKHSCPVWK